VRKILTIRLNKKLARALQAEADDTGLAKSKIARQALQFRFPSKPKLRVMNQYFGIMAGPSDLSTNRAYRKTQS
jgi:hypothetical protein